MKGGIAEENGTTEIEKVVTNVVTTKGRSTEVVVFLTEGKIEAAEVVVPENVRTDHNCLVEEKVRNLAVFKKEEALKEDGSVKAGTRIIRKN